MKYISKKLKYNDEYLDHKIPDNVKYFASKENELPFFVYENFFSPELCDELYHDLTTREGLGKAQVHSLDFDNPEKLDETIRNTFQLNLTKKQKHIYKKKFKQIIPEINDFYNIIINGSEGCHALGYSTGCKYKLHADNCDPKFDKHGGFHSWFLSRSNRVLSTLLYLSDSVDEVKEPNQYKGGDLSFNYLFDENNEAYKFKPKKGLFLAFPSHPYFSHEVHEITDGYRVAIVEWHYAKILKPSLEAI